MQGAGEVKTCFACIVVVVVFRSLSKFRLQAASKAADDAQKALMAILPVGDLFKALV